MYGDTRVGGELLILIFAARACVGHASQDIEASNASLTPNPKSETLHTGVRRFHKITQTLLCPTPDIIFSCFFLLVSCFVFLSFTFSPLSIVSFLFQHFIQSGEIRFGQIRPAVLQHVQPGKSFVADDHQKVFASNRAVFIPKQWVTVG